jgi:probable HAF family extracellular repeat protein
MINLSFTRRLARVSTMALAIACLSGTAQAAGYTVTWLGDLPGGTNSSFATGINDAGTVVGRSFATTGSRGFVWDAANGMTDLGDLPGGSNYSYAYAINNAGQVAGGAKPRRAPVRSCGTPGSCRTSAICPAEVIIAEASA